MADDKEFRYYRGEGGVTWELELPLSPEMADQVRTGKLIEVPKPSDVGDDTGPRQVAVREPAPHEPKSVWVDYAVAHGMSYADAQNASRNELVERFATKPDDVRPDVADPADTSTDVGSGASTPPGASSKSRRA